MLDKILIIQAYLKSANLECQGESHANKRKHDLLLSERTFSVYKTFRRRSKEVQDVFWTSFVHSIYFLSQWGN